MKNHKRKAIGLLGLLVTVLIHPLVLAKEDKPCQQDIQQFCQGVQPGGGRIPDCLKQHESELSEGCKQYRAEIKEKVSQELKVASTACSKDVEKFCEGVQPGKGAGRHLRFGNHAEGRRVALAEEHPALETALPSEHPFDHRRSHLFAAADDFGHSSSPSRTTARTFQTGRQSSKT